MVNKISLQALLPNWSSMYISNITIWAGTKHVLLRCCQTCLTIVLACSNWPRMVLATAMLYCNTACTLWMFWGNHSKTIVNIYLNTLKCLVPLLFLYVLGELLYKTIFLRIALFFTYYILYSSTAITWWSTNINKRHNLILYSNDPFHYMRATATYIGTQDNPIFVSL